MRASTPLLVVGYAVATPLTLRVLRIAWRREGAQMLALEAGTAAVVAGWALRGEALPAWMNAGFGVGFAATWVAVGRVRRRREEAAADR